MLCIAATPFYCKWPWSCSRYLYLSYSTGHSIFPQVSTIHCCKSLPDDYLKIWNLQWPFPPIDFPLSFIIWYGNNKHLKESPVFQTKSLYSKSPFLSLIIRNNYSHYLIFQLLVQWHRAQNTQVTISIFEISRAIIMSPYKSHSLLIFKIPN